MSTYRNALALIKEMDLTADLRPISDWITLLKDARAASDGVRHVFALHAPRSGMLSVRDLARFTLACHESSPAADRQLFGIGSLR